MLSKINKALLKQNSTLAKIKTLYELTMTELLVPEYTPEDKILVSDLIDKAFGRLPWWLFAHPKDFIVLHWYQFGIVLIDVEEVLFGYETKRIFWRLSIDPLDITGFLLAKFRNHIPLVRSDSTSAPAI